MGSLEPGNELVDSGWIPIADTLEKFLPRMDQGYTAFSLARCLA